MTPDLIAFDCGALRGYISQTSGQLRYLRLGHNELLRGIYGSVRLPNWSTVNPKLSDFKMDKSATGFVCTFTSTHSDPALSFTWNGRLEAVIVKSNEVLITYEFEGTAQADLSTNRLGLCILHPASLQGTSVELSKSDSSCLTSEFPKNVSGNPIFEHFSAMYHTVGDFARVRIEVEGDDFETEDQRNFGDASYKTYCHLQKKGAPYKVAKGTIVKQKATVYIQFDPLKIDKRTAKSHAVAIPMIGTAIKSEADLATAKALKLSHVRCKPELAAAAQKVGMPIELESADGTSPVPLKTSDKVLVSTWNRDKRTGKHPATYMAAERVLEYVSTKPNFAGWAGASVEMHPQTHQFDTETIMESPWVLCDMVTTARTLGAKDVILGPLEVAPYDDPRSKTIDGALFAIGCIANAAMMEVNSITLMDAETLSNGPAKAILQMIGGGPVTRGAKVWTFEPEMVVVDTDNFRVVANLSWESSSTHMLTNPNGKHHKMFDSGEVLLNGKVESIAGVPKTVPPRSITVIYR
ncbi:MAG TPA: hypothetical protein VK171_13780 [Fimbriimonas sp.]|nr:hypothetical protein [Fimbriimonas sp.]